ncbi:hypothetical protein FB451DRAFT_1373931 [Mycena latifolia]|nr:hypothetical protein FB451DRAFT_1373931 [Mycena latifolia]
MLVVAAFWSSTQEICGLAVANIIYPVIYGLMALTFGRLLHHPPILHGLSVGFIGLIIQILLVFAIFRLAKFLPRLRKFFNKLRFPRFKFYDGAFHRSDWTPDILRLLFYSGLMWLTPIGITIMLTTRSHTMLSATRRLPICLSWEPP